MKLRWLSLVLLLAPGLIYAGDLPRGYAEANVVDFLRTSDVTVLVRISSYTIDKEIRDVLSGHVGYIRFKVRGQVLESFRGARRGPITFYVSQEQPSHPPESGDYIVSLNKVDGDLVFADDSVWWMRATPELVAAARRAR